MCLIYNQSLAHYKASNLKRYHEQNHDKFISTYPHNSNLRTSKLNVLKSELQNQQKLLMSFSTESDASAKASFIIL